MKIVFYSILCIVVAGVAYSLAPDVARYLKIKSM